MANAALKITIGQSLGGGSYNSTVGGIARPDLSTLSTGLDVTDVETAVATLESDGASPTETHVGDLRTAWDVLSAACTAASSGINSVDADVTVTWDTTNITTKNQLRHALKLAIAAIDGNNLLS